MDDTYIELAKSYDFSVDYRGPWAVCGKSTKVQGWKIHLSVIPKDAIELLTKVFPILKKSQIPFKFARDSYVLGGLNEGSFGQAQAGKFITIYPPSDEDFAELADLLSKETDGLRGPSIVTDYYIGGVVYVRYGSFNPIVKRDRLGNFLKLIQGTDGIYSVDEYTVPALHTNNNVPTLPPYLSCKKNTLGTEQKVIGPGYLLLKILRESPRGFVYLGIDIRRQEQVRLVVLKEGRKDFSCDVYNRDMRDRIKHQYLTHTALSGLEFIPKCYEYFEFHENNYIALEYIDGISLVDMFALSSYEVWGTTQRVQTLNILEKICRSLQKMHRFKYIHRDLTPRNIIINQNGRAFLIDLELSWSKDLWDKPFALGTPGFTSPQQLDGEIPTTQDDIFSVGAIIFWLLASIDPVRLPKESNNKRKERLLTLINAPLSFVGLISRCLDHNPKERPTLQELIKELNKLQNDPITYSESLLDIQKCDKVTQTKHESISSIISTINEKLQNYIIAITNDVMLDDQYGLWCSPLDESHYHENPKFSMFLDSGLLRSAYRGVAGPLYVLARLKKSGFEIHQWKETVEKGLDWLLSHEPTKDDQLPGLYFGEAGIAVTIAELTNSKFIETEDWLETYLLEVFNGPYDWPDITHGVAGQGISSLLCSDLLNESKWASFSQNAVDYLLSSQEKNGSWRMPEGVEGMSGKVYTGFAHGVAGIIYFLTEFYSRYHDKKVWCAIELAVSWLIKQSVEQGQGTKINWPSEENGNAFWHSWCHGAPGISLTFLKLYELTNEQIFLDIVNKALFSPNDTIRNPNFTTCCGLLGHGEIYLEAERITGNSIWLHQASYIAKSLLALGYTSPSGGFSCAITNNHTRTADLMTGESGLIHFLLRFSQHHTKRLSFPLLI